MTGPHLLHGLPEAYRAAAAALYWQAFGGKLGRVLGPDARAEAFLRRVIRADHALAVIENGRLIGLAGFKSPEGGFADGNWADLRAVYGLIGGLWRLAMMRAMTSDVDNHRFLVDGICVAPGARRRGIGRALVAGLLAEGTRRGYRAVRLEVVETNAAARTLYQRQGFAPVYRQDIGLMRHVFGYQAAITMVRPLD